jgi:hypothetical protein
LKRDITDSYTKTEVQTFLNTKADSGDLLQINTTGTTYNQITHLAFDNASVALSNSNTLATVTATPSISNVVGLQAELALKRDISDSYTLTEINSFLSNKANSIDLVKLDIGSSTYQQITQLTFSNGSSSVSGTLGTVNITPNLSDIQGLSMLTTSGNNSVFDGKLTVSSDGDAYSSEKDILYFMDQSTGSAYHKIVCRFSNTADYGNYLKFGIRGANGLIYSSLSLHGDLSARFYGSVGIGSTDPAMALDVNNGAVIRTEVDCWNSEQICLRLCRGNRGGISEQQHQICMKIHNSNASNNYLKFKVHEFGGSASSNVVDSLRLNGDQSAIFSGAVTGVSFTSTSDQSVKDDVQDINLTPVFDNCNVKSYNRIDKPELGKRIGFIAQDIEKACEDNNLPNTFTRVINPADEEGNDELLGLDYSRLVCVLWSKVKQLEMRLAVLEKKKK